MRFLLLLLAISVAVWLGLHQCKGEARRTLVVKPSASFPQEKKALLGQSVARVLPHCPGFQKLGAELEFTDLREDGDVLALHFVAPDSPSIPEEWRARGLQCVLRLEKQAFSLGGRAGCQALCLGEPGVEGRETRKELGGKDH
jgi:hypothetical protein